ncbi:MAG: tRNA pseudouridine(55) synthase TruB [Gammaproteobacteria bacterium]|jgi:tRNA pseudouridine55 synthase|nr:tRNA pseudouridine(55) synthase TruB [Gammaproteobacteria bacterium]
MLDLSKSCLILDKPSGISSNNALKEVKKKLHQKKAGFSGTLDPLASGLLIIFFNKATKLCSLFLNANKNYEAIMKLGVTSTTADLDGEIIKRSDIPDIAKKDLEKLEIKYTGKVNQVPPMYSALKYNGMRLYEYARKGINIDRPSREINIFKIELILLDKNHISIKVKCSKGTYIRTLAEQIGNDIGCGAIVSELRRTKINEIDLSKSIKLNDLLSSSEEDICKKYIVNADVLLQDINSCYLSKSDTKEIVNGNKVKINENPCEIVRIYDLDKKFIGIGKINDNFELLPNKIFV